jgi:hypothetical protein
MSGSVTARGADTTSHSDERWTVKITGRVTMADLGILPFRQSLIYDQDGQGYSALQQIMDVTEVECGPLPPQSPT